MKGKGSQPQKLDKLNELFEMCSKTDEIEYIVRILLRNLRLGMTEKSILPLLE
jgi:ATP-dependent DNA ligase